MLTLLLADENGYLPIGRSRIRDGALAVYWPNSGFSVRFKARSAIVSFKPFSSGAPLYLKAFLDGKATKHTVATGDEKLLFESLDDGEHTLTLLRVSESIDALRIESVTLLGENAAFLDPPAEKERRIEFFGDSITCGYGVLAEPTVTGYTTFEQDSTMAYAYMTAEKLNASGRYEAISGQGILCNCNGEKALEITKFYRWTLRDETPWDFSLWTPDVVVVNAGTNDSWGGVDSAAFGAKADEFLRELREVYPDALLIWAYGMMDVRFTDTLTAVVAALGDERVRFLPLAPIDLKNGDVGGGGHPNVNASIRVSDLLAKTIKNELGW